MKVDFFIEFGGNKADYNAVVARVKEIWKADGKLMKDLESVEIYYKPEENMCYYVINEDQKGSFEA
ncbi:MAG: DUF6465 family protein [Defluviitaleaceae bacterium]|nr:DUF6465 family protein [Defluviitaleaceae bacterium]